MKSAFIVSFISLGFAWGAWAQSGSGDAGCPKPKVELLDCGSEAKKGYTVEFETTDQKTVVRLKGTSAFHTPESLPGLVAEYPCFRKAPDPNGGPDKPTNVLDCYDPQVVDAGFRISLTTPDFVGQRYATVFELTFAGVREAARLNCPGSGLGL
jgi:hypothetical protein